MPEPDRTILHWTLVNRTELHDCRVFNLEQRRMREEISAGVDNRNPKEADFFVLRSPDWVNVVALTDDEQLVLIEQWRQGVQRVTLEVPGGMVDEGETPLDAAKRELAEETGYAAKEWQKLGQIDPNPAILDNQCHTFLALGCEKRFETKFDTTEDCKLVLKPYTQAGDLVRSDRFRHALVIVALFHERLRRESLE